MTTKSLTWEQLKQIPIFAGLTEDQCRVLVDECDLIAAEPGKTLVAQHGTSQDLWILLEGRCEVSLDPDQKTIKKPLLLAVLEPYSNFGEMSFFHSKPHSASVRAQTAAQLLRLERPDFDEIVAVHPAIAARLAMNTVASLAERMRRMDAWVAELVVEKSQAQKVPDIVKLRQQLFDSWKL